MKNISKYHNMELYFSNNLAFWSFEENTSSLGYTIFTKDLWHTSCSKMVSILSKQKVNTFFHINLSLKLWPGLCIQSIKWLNSMRGPYVCIQLLSSPHTRACTQSRLFAAPRTVACPAPLSTEFSRQEYWSGLPFPSPGDLPEPRMEPTSLASPALAEGFSSSPPTTS